MTAVLAVDVGTTAVKAACFDIDGTQRATAYVEHHVQRTAGGRVEQQPQVLDDAVDGAIQQVVSAQGDITAVAVTGARASFLAADHHTRPLVPWILWQDHRGEPQVDQLRHRIDADTYRRITGLTLTPTATISKAMWLAQTEPATAAQVGRLWGTADWALHRLGAEDPPMAPSAAAYFGAYDLTHGRWSRQLIAAANLPPSWLPPVAAASRVVGQVSPEAAQRTGLQRGTALVLAGSDWSCCMTGSNAHGPGQTVAYLGTAASLGAPADEAVHDPNGQLTCLPYDGGHYEVEALVLSAGGAHQWYRDQLARATDYSAVERELSEVDRAEDDPIGLATFYGSGAPTWDPQARGALLGLQLRHSRAHIGLALLEGVCHELRSGLSAMRHLGIEVEEVIVTGGATRSDLWLQMQADVFGLPVRTTTTADPTLVGAGMHAAVGIGAHPCLPDAGTAMVQLGPTREPNPTLIQRYTRRFDVFVQAQQTLTSSGLNRAMSDLTHRPTEGDPR